MRSKLPSRTIKHAGNDRNKSDSHLFQLKLFPDSTGASD